MRYVILFSMAIILAGGCQKTYVAVEAKKAKLTEAESREVFKSERLGEELYLQDTTAARASRSLLEVVGPIQPGVLSGWIIVKDGPSTLTRFIKQTGEDINVIYDVQIDVKGNSKVTKDNLRPLSKTELAMFRARQNAMRAAPKECTRAYNTAVMEDLDSNGWLVYILAAASRDVIVVGGHSRVKVSPDGNNVLVVTPLYEKCLAMPVPAEVKNPKDEAFSVSYSVADVPSEIHVYLNRLYGYTVYVTTPKGTWRIKDGRIAVIEKVKPGQTDKAGKRK